MMPLRAGDCQTKFRSVAAQFGLRARPVKREIPSAARRAGSSLRLKNGSAQDDNRRVIEPTAPLPLVLRWSQVLVHGDFEVHEFGAFGVVDAADVDAGAGEGSGDVAYVEEEESGLGGVGLDGFGGELRGVDLVALFLGDGALYIFLRNGERDFVQV